MRRLRGIAALAPLLLALQGLVGAGQGPARAFTAPPATATNVRVSHDGAPAHAEPSVAVNARDPTNLLGTSMLLDPRRQTALAAYASFDGGRTWQDDGALRLPPNTVWGDDVTAAFDGQGSGFIAAMATSGRTRDDRGVYVWRTDDGGRTFRPPVAAMRGAFADHPSLAADTAPGASALYVAWVAQDHAALGFSRSTNGGRAFSAPRNINGAQDNGVSTPAVAASPSGGVYVVYESGRRGANPPAAPDTGLDSVPADGAVASRERAGPSPAGTDAQVEIVSSADHGRTFGRPAVLGVVPSYIAASAQEYISTAPAVAASPRGHDVYVAFAGYTTTVPHTDIFVSHSPDGGHTWSPPVAVLGGHAAAITFQPSIAVAPDGSVAVSFFAVGDGRVSLLLARAPAGGATFGPPAPVSDRPFDPLRGMRGHGTSPKDSLWWIGDYQGLAAGPTALYPFWNDTRTGRLEIFSAAVPLTTTTH